MSRFRKMFKIAGIAGVVIVGGGTVALTQKMFVDRHAMVRKKSFKRDALTLCLFIQLLQRRVNEL